LSRKYKLTEELNEGGFYRIKALRDIPRFNVKSGDLGGWVESEENLSQEDDCWISEEALVSGNARVYENALVSGEAWVYADARVYGNARISGEAWIYWDTRDEEE
jgi:carbonic anhydrase/acetyltransferase-like protein (isoleucine patch superfamily)